MASDYSIWASAVRQYGGVLVDDFDQMMNLVMFGTGRKALGGKRVGFLGAGGGVSVIFTDLALQAGLSLPELKEKTQRLIGKKIKGVNTSTANPVDLGAFGFDLKVMSHTMKALDEDDGIDVIIPYFSVEGIMRSEIFLNVKNNEQTFFEMAEEIEKPIIPILSCFTEDNLDVERSRISTFSALRKAGFPVYPKIQDAVYSIGIYWEWVAKQIAAQK
jgi:acyl-CoA synthetase (NDP forming)